MPLVRVRMTNGLETNIGEAWAKAEGLEILDEPTTNGDGTPRPQSRKSRRVKPKTSVSEEATKKKAHAKKAAAKQAGGTEPAPTAEEAS